MGVSHLEIITGHAKQFRAQEAAPTDPTPKMGDVYIDTTPGVEAFGVYTITGWIYFSLKA